MEGYIKRNDAGVKEIRDGNVMPEMHLSYGERHTMSSMDWGWYWNRKMQWDVAKVIPVFPGFYFAFPEEGKVEYDLFGRYAVPVDAHNTILPI